MELNEDDELRVFGAAGTKLRDVSLMGLLLRPRIFMTPGSFIANNIDFLMGHRHLRSIISGFSILNVITAPTGGALPAECEWRWIETCWL